MKLESELMDLHSVDETLDYQHSISDRRFHSLLRKCQALISISETYHQESIFRNKIDFF